MNDNDRSRLADYRAQLHRAAEHVAEIDAGKITYHEARGDGPMKNVTTHRRAELIQQIALLDAVIKLMEAGDGPLR